MKESVAGYAITETTAEKICSLNPEKEYDKVALLLERLEQMTAIMDRGAEAPVEGIRDMKPILATLELPGAFLEGIDLFHLAEFLSGVSRIKAFFQKHKDIAPGLLDIFHDFVPLPEIVKKIHSLFKEDGEIKDNATPELKRLRRMAASSEKSIQTILRNHIRKLSGSNVLQEEYYTLRGDRYVLPVRSGARNKVQGIVHDASKSGETLFIEPMGVVESANELAEIRIAIREELKRILFQTTEEVRTYIDQIRLNWTLAIEFDLLYSKSRFASRHNLSIPAIVPDGTLELMNAHHPLLYLSSRERSVPLNLRLDEGDKILVISGPNAGGKTTALKTAGLLTMMVQAGLAVPVFPDSRFPIFQGWYADIGDAQDVTEGVSTFSAHIRKIIQIINECNEHSLILLDELGTATDPMEGGALAVAILETLGPKAALTIATSHLSPVKAWAHDYSSARNASFRLDSVTHQPTYEIILDIPGASEALHIARREGLPEAVLERASEVLPKGEIDLSEILQSLKKKEKELNERKKEVSKLLREQKTLRKRIVELQDFLNEKERRLNMDMMEEKERILKNTRRYIEKKIARLPGKKAMKEARRDVTREIQIVQKKKKELVERDVKPADPDQFYEGQPVTVSSMRDTGRIISIDRSKMSARIAVGGMEINAPLASLHPSEEVSASPPPVKKIRFTKRNDLSVEKDLHGMRVDEMLSEVEQYLNDAVLADLPYVKLMHGIGTGALRRALHDYLRQHPLVNDYRFGKPEEGGGGVTIVTFKSEA